MTDDEDWTSSPKRYTGMNAAPSGHKVVYETKDSGERVEFPTGMKRDVTGDKTRWDLLIPANHPAKGMLQRWAELLTRGAQKYEARNWEKAETVEEYDRFRESLFRHFMMYWLGYTDEDHAAAIFFNIEGLEYVRAKLEQTK